ncbi:enoyl-CoA hydratase-related protein [Sinimarinibacterium sp. NLF-5-8]|uniref:enoyl-CoA hydratase-related protein n=1 Tax=Sinimarinibacterium sp. NLF-5-8 TaxID=2698684 RepID=UPI00137C3CD5|nr:enoyl-CoA hydratase-related protein [Sinimarinibacterium sp. NLF-5-8]QHS10304.1 2-(1,2-epoxy-1,2-dihydrophenyl)acetyl-CoA isomerase [Sinimarinibacterium sp. NLF-5-8]
MSLPPIRVTCEPPIAILSLDRPEKLNAMDIPLLAELRKKLVETIADEAIGAIILTGEGVAFSAGADLAATLDNLPRDAQGEIDLACLLREYYNPILHTMQSSPKPVIAAVNGVAAGGASSLAFMADLTLAARSARFSQAFVRVGLIPDVGGSWILPRTLGWQHALGTALLGCTLSADEAFAKGLIWSVVDDRQQLLNTARQLALQLASIPPVTFAAIKQGLRSGMQKSFDAQLDLEAELQGACGRAEFHALANRFLQR